jgi:hypothetical protein
MCPICQSEAHSADECPGRDGVRDVDDFDDEDNEPFNNDDDLDD